MTFLFSKFKRRGEGKTSAIMRMLFGHLFFSFHFSLSLSSLINSIEKSLFAITDALMLGCY
jgi:hypothetical protein